MGLGKTFVGAEKLNQLSAAVNLIVCQKSKIQDWIDHFNLHYKYHVLDLTKKDLYAAFWDYQNLKSALPVIGVINYDLVFRRKELLNLENFTLLLDESSLIQNEAAKRTRFILKMKPKNVTLLSGTPTGGKYERLWTQLHLLGWDISKKLYWNQFINVRYLDGVPGRSIPIVTGYKNVDRLKNKMQFYGCQFLKTSEVFELPKQIFQSINVDITPEYKTFRKTGIVSVSAETAEGDPKELVGDTLLTKMLCERKLCGQYNGQKLTAFRDLLESTEERFIVFYNFTAELEALRKIANELKRPVSIVNGQYKGLGEYEKRSDSVTFIQYQAGAMGLNLQLANRIIYFTPPLSSELYEQSKKRIHRIGQEKTCFYYKLVCKKSVEEKIYKALKERKDYTNKLFEKGV